METKEDPLEDWLDSLLERFLSLRDGELAQDIELDFSGESLDRLEAAMLERFDFADDVHDPDEQDFVLGVAGYLGEVLLRLAGGSWAWPDGPDSGGHDYLDSGGHDVPFVVADPVLELDSVSPIDLIMTAVRVGDGQQFGALYLRWESAVRRARTERPSWHPAKQPTDLDLLEPADTADLPTWLVRREADFADWTAAYAPGATLDFSRESLDALEEAVRRAVPTREDLVSTANREFLDGASWYLGEVIRRELGGQWMLEGSSDINPGGRCLRRVGPYEGKIVPALTLGNAIDQPGHLIAHYDTFSGRVDH
ncbi:hypothetical protein GCM10027280_59390 [Micromonospora polyrhachis]|uniref:Uncharacterized protein n=1 Tax=Micromonospora polyrhachis TaxID=1282883 RepID=A0A7W7SUM2_9ACTN|nr:hypothetical protein [Micromonospora polyrhachis]MBB4961254.1 hypothetical protein [Micromonospora polyrhachis]